MTQTSLQSPEHVSEKVFGLVNFEPQIAAFYEAVSVELQSRSDSNSEISRAVEEEIRKGGVPSVFQEIFRLDKQYDLMSESIPYDKNPQTVGYVMPIRGGEAVRVAETRKLYVPMCDIAINLSVEFKELKNSRIPLYARAYVSLAKQVDCAAMSLIAHGAGPRLTAQEFSKHLPEVFSFLRRRGGSAHAILATASAHERLKIEAKTNKELHILSEREVGAGGIAGDYDGVPIFLPVYLPQEGTDLYITDQPERVGVIAGSKNIMVVPVDDRNRLRCGLVMFAQFGAGILDTEAVIKLSL